MYGDHRPSILFLSALGAVNTGGHYRKLGAATLAKKQRPLASVTQGYDAEDELRRHQHYHRCAVELWVH